MVLPIPPFNPSDAIPNSPFYEIITQSNIAICSSAGPLVVGSCLCADVRNATICALICGGPGTVTLVDTGDGLTGGPITTSGTIALSASGVTPGSYSFATLTVDTYGRVRVASNGRDATTSSAGIVALATNSETLDGISGSKAVTPTGLQFKITDCVSCLDPYRIASASAVKCAYDTALSRVPSSAYSAKGTLLGGGATAGSYSALPLGGDGQVLTACKDSPSGLVWTCGTPSEGGIPLNCVADKGVIVVGSGPCLPTPLFTGRNGTVLTANSCCPLGVDWVPVQQVDSIPCACITGRGSLITGTASSTPVALSLGGEGEYLRVCCCCCSGIAWGPSPAGIPISCLTGKGVLITATALGCIYTLPGPACAGQILSSTSSTTGAGFEWVDNLALPITDYNKKGRLIVGSANGPCCLDVTFDDYSLVACSSCPEGVAWKQVIGAGIPCECLIDIGYMIVGCGKELPYSLPPGAPGEVLTVCNTVPGGVVWSGSGGNGIPTACLTKKGVIVAGSDTNTPISLLPGTNGLFLSACSDCPSGLTWVAAGNSGGIPSACIVGKGSLVTGSDANAPFALPVGGDGQVLVACSVCDGGLTWVSEVGETYIPTACLTGKGAIVTGGDANSPVALSPGGNGLVLVACSDCTEGLTWVSFPAEPGIPCACITDKGTLISGTNSNTPAALPVGSNGLVLTACCDAPTGLAWCSVSVPGGGIPCSCLVSKGALVTATASDTPAAFPSGGNGLFLQSCDACPCGLTWSSTTTGTGIPCACITKKGALISGSDANAPETLLPGTDGLFLQACSLCPLGLDWVAAPGGGGIPCATLDRKGAIVTTATSNNPVALHPGTDGLVLTACQEAEYGLCWASFGGDPGIPCSTIIGKGGLVTGTASSTPVGLAIGNEGQVLKVCCDCPQGLTWANTQDTGGIPSSTLTRKGGIIVALQGDTPTELLPGTNGLVLTACCDAPTGLAWCAYTSPSSIPTACITGKGAIVTGSDSNSPVALPLGGEGQVLRVCCDCPIGLTWSEDNYIPEACLTNKGTLISASDSAIPEPVPIGGEDGLILTVDCNTPSGLAWCKSKDIPLSCFQNRGELLVGFGINESVALPVGNNHQQLIACCDACQGVAWVDPPPAAIPCCVIGNCGSLVVGCGPADPGSFPLGTDGLVLTVCRGCDCGLVWASFPGDPGIPCSVINDKGALITGTLANQPVALPAGSDGLVLTACQEAETGLCWASFGEDPGIPCSVINKRGTLITGEVANNPLPLEAGLDGQVLAANSGTGLGLNWITLTPPVPLCTITCKGVLITGSDTNIALPLEPGGNGQFLVADSAAELGLSWCTPDPSIPCSLLSSAGHLAIGTLNGVESIGPGENCQVLAICNCCTTTGGVYWKTIPDASLNIPCSALSEATKGTILVSVGTGICSFGVGAPGTYLRACPEVPEGVVWEPAVEDLPVRFLACCGSLITATDTCCPATLYLGENGQQLTVSDASPTGLDWVTPVAGVPCSCYLDKGTLLVGFSQSQPVPILAPPSEGRYLRYCSQCYGGVFWSEDSITAAGPIIRGGVFGCTDDETASFNTSVGWCSLDGGTGLCNSALGWFSGVNSGAGCANTSIGHCSFSFSSAGGAAPCFNTHVGALSGSFYVGNEQTAIGYSALGVNSTGTSNTAIGFCSLSQATACENTAVGWCSLSQILGGQQNTAVGYNSMGGAQGNECAVVAVGWRTGFAGSAASTAVGYRALENATSPSHAAFGYFSMLENTTGTLNSAFGAESLRNNRTGSNNSAFGYRALNQADGGSDNVALGSFSQGLSTAAEGNTSVGSCALNGVTGGNYNVAVGYLSLFENQNGGSNIAIGKESLKCNIGNLNVAVGDVSLLNNTGSNNVGIGASTLYLATTAEENVSVGRCAGFATTTGGCNTFIGSFAGLCNAGSAYNTAVGHNSLRNNCSGCNVAVGAQSLQSNTIGTENTAVGYQSMCGSTGAGSNTAVGFKTLVTLLGGMQNIGFGTCSLYSNTNGNNNIGVGHCSLFGNTTGQNNIAIGSFSLNKVTFGYNNIGIGYNAGGSLTQGIENIAIGTCALKSSNSQCNIALGVRALENGSIGGFSTVVGHDSFTKVNGYCNTAVGFKAGCLNEGSCNVVLGNFALNSPSAIGRSIAIGTWSMSDLGEGDENLAIGVCALKGDGVGSPAGCNQLAIGNYALECSTQNQQVAVGWCALHLGGVDGDIAIGHEAHRSVPNQATTTQTQASVYIGQCAGYDISETSQRSVSLGALVSTNQRENSANVAIGYCSNVGRSSQNTFNYNNTLVGACTAQLMSDVYNSVAIGADTGCLGDAFKSRTDVTGCFAETTAIGSRALNSGRCYIGVIAIGYQAGSVNGYQAIKEACENITIIGNINTLEHYIAGECRSSIDNRYKNILGDAPAGLPYINSLSTVTYQRCDPDTNQLLSTTCYYGVDSASAIAAEQTPGSPLLMETSGVSQDNHHISKDGLITMLVNSVQELSAQVTALQAQVDALSNP